MILPTPRQSTHPVPSQRDAAQSGHLPELEGKVAEEQLRPGLAEIGEGCGKGGVHSGCM